MRLGEEIKQKTMEHLYICKSIIEESTAKICKKKYGKKFSPEDKNRMAKIFPWWYVDEFEKLAK